MCKHFPVMIQTTNPTNHIDIFCMQDLFAKLDHNYRHVMVHVISVIITFHTHGTGISAGIVSALYRDCILQCRLVGWNFDSFLEVRAKEEVGKRKWKGKGKWKICAGKRESLKDNCQKNEYLWKTMYDHALQYEYVK